MKKIVIWTLVSACLLMTQKAQALDHISMIYEMEGRELAAFAEGKLPNYVIEVPSGTRFPFSFALSGDLIEFDQEEEIGAVWIHVLKTFFVKNEDNEMRFSLDGQNWKEFSELFTGNLSASLGKYDGVLAGTIALETHLREPSISD